MSAKLNPITDDELTSEDIAHGFFTRDGGVSTGIYEGLNCGVGSDDDQQHILENRTRIANLFGLGHNALVTAYQVHSPDVAVVTQPWQKDERPKLDALVSNTPNLAIGILTADCGPVLFADKENKVIGAAHAGWKGATGGVLENTVLQMENLGASRDNIQAVLGPTISAAAYEVGSEFIDNLISMNTKNDKYLTPSHNENHAMFDLPAYIVERLNAFGVTAAWTGICTYDTKNNLFSYRRTTHNKEADYGRQLSAIKINQ